MGLQGLLASGTPAEGRNVRGDTPLIAAVDTGDAILVDTLLQAGADVNARAPGTPGAALDALGPAMQKRLHEQGFGTAPVDDIIARIEDKLPDIAKEAGVDVIVSKWTLTYRSPAAKFVDVTGLIAAEFDPDAVSWRPRARS